MDAAHFRQRAARARELAQSGDDIRLSRMLLEVALDLDAEAEAMETGSASDRRSVEVMRETGPFDALLYEAGARTNGKPVWIIDLSLGGARFRADTPQSPGSQVTLELRDHSVRLDGAISRVRGLEAAMVFRPDPRSDPAFSRLLRSDFPMEHPVRV